MAQDENNGAGGAAEGQAGDRQIGLRQVYLKDASFESPNTPEVFTVQQEGEFKTGIKNLSTNTNRLDDSNWEVVQAVTVEATLGDKTAFLCEVQMAGIFTIGGFSQEETHHLLGAYCPSQLFPFTRELVHNLVGKGGFPGLMLPVINFDDLYRQQLAQAQQQGAQN